MVIFSKQDQRNPLALTCNQEWLETNGLGSYASSTILDYPTRRYHGLLVAQLHQPFGKFVLLSRFEEYFNDGVQNFPLSLQSYANNFDTQAFVNINAFNLELNPAITFQCGSLTLTKEILMMSQKNKILIKYRLSETSPNFKLTLRPLLAYRSFHDLTHANIMINTKSYLVKDGVIFSPYEGMPSLHIYGQKNWQYMAKPYWYYAFAYAEEKARGYDFTEDLFSPGMIELSFEENQEIIIACALEEVGEYDLTEQWQAEISRRIKNRDIFTVASLDNQLKARAANQVILEPAPNAYSIIAGYHWFTQWGRDAMISLAGLTLFSNKEPICLQILQHFAAHEDHGIIPNRISPNASKKNEYDSIDGSLLFCRAVQQYYLSTKNINEVKKTLWPVIKNIIFYYRNGTYFNIKQQDNGLIYGGSPEIKLTWMDVVINGVALTPRNGAAVEINALWYNAVCFAAELAKLFQEEQLLNELIVLAPLIKKSFIEIFWNPEQNCLYDFVNDQEKNCQCRPNQIFAAALPYCVLDAPMASRMIQAVVTQLLTPYGLRSLAASDKDYHGVYEGNEYQRDIAYHNGTVWPWLLGPLTDALLRFFSKEYACEVLQPCVVALLQHVNNEAGLGCVSEIFDGDAPHKPRGCILQAWSVAEVIRMVHLLK